MSRLPGGRLLTTRSPILIRAARDLLEPREHAQRGGLAAAGRADEDHELAVVHVEVEVGDGKEAVAVGLGHVVEGDSGHGLLLHGTGGRVHDPPLEDEEQDRDRDRHQHRRRELQWVTVPGAELPGCEL